MPSVEYRPAMTHLDAPPAIAAATRAYLSARDALDAAWDAVAALPFTAPARVDACLEWDARRVRCQEARHALRESFTSCPGRYRVGDVVVELRREITRGEDLVVRRIGR